MKSSVCVTVLDEGKAIFPLIESLLSQSKKPDEIVIVDGESRDKTVEIIKHFQKKDARIRLLVQKCSRSEGRNLAIEMAKNKIIVMTDAGCVADKHWLKNITKPFENPEVDVVAGFYEMKANNLFEKAESFFLGVLPSKFDINFLPSTRSIAFRKEIWEKVGGFPENLEDTAEDTVFNFKLLKNKAKFARVKNAVVEWGMPKNLKEFFLKVFRYAKGDAKSKIWFFPNKGIASHNIKTLFKLLRYLAYLILVLITFHYSISPIYLFSLLFLYIIWSFRKVYLEFREVEVSLWGVILQFVSDIAAISGFMSGIVGI